LSKVAELMEAKAGLKSRSPDAGLQACYVPLNLHFPAAWLQPMSVSGPALTISVLPWAFPQFCARRPFIPMTLVTGESLCLLILSSDVSPPPLLREGSPDPQCGS
jgi:hypothetical protein